MVFDNIKALMLPIPCSKIPTDLSKGPRYSHSCEALLSVEKQALKRPDTQEHQGIPHLLTGEVLMLDGHDTRRVGVSNFLQLHPSNIVISLQANSIVQHADAIIS